MKFTFGEAMVGTICWNDSLARPLSVYGRAGSAYAKGRPKEHLELRDVYYDALKKSTILRESCNIASPYVTNHARSRVSTLHTTHIAHVLP